MAALESLKDHWREQRSFTRRVVFAGVVAVVVTLIVLVRLVVLQVLNFEHFRDLSAGNRVRIEPIPPTRGLIFDRNGELLAENLPAYQLELIPEQVRDLEATLQGLRELSLLREEDEPRIARSLKRNPRRFQPIVLRYRLSEEELARFSVQRQRFPGVEFRARLARHYPLGETAVHAIGYVGSLSASDAEKLDPAAYAGTTHVGKAGVERAYEAELHGTVGYQQVLVNAQGRALDVLDSVPPKPGHDLFLSIDVRLQIAAERALEGRRGAVVAVDPFSGDVLALVSSPGYDPNPFGEGLSRRDYRALVNDGGKPLFNRALSGHYPPGSTIKPILGLASLHYNSQNPWNELYCPGHFSLPGNDHRYRDWKKEGHGSVNLMDAIEQSCDVYFYELALSLGIDRMHEFMAQFGFGSRLGVDIQGETAGVLPSRDWKRQNFRDPAQRVWFPGETVITGIGQGFFLTTPLQLAHATAIVAARGERFAPKLIDAVRDPLTGDIVRRPPRRMATVDVANPTHWQQIIDGMIAVVHGRKGTAKLLALERPYRVAGKTGTAQVYTIAQEDEYDEETVAEELRHHGWFVAFAPADDPQIALSVIVENGGGSSAATPVAAQLLDTWFADTQLATRRDNPPAAPPPP